VRFTINEKGRVDDVNVVESTPPGVFDDAAQTAVRKWLYEPRRENGVEVPSKGQVKLVFEPQ
jgi:protein TonB